MASGVLEFAIGLTTGSFLSKLGEADGRLKGFIGSMLSLGAITEGVMKSIEKGAGLEALHKRTGESVRDLYMLQQGFKAAGLSADSAQEVLLHMQRAIGGVNEMGESTPDIFRRMGLNIEDLKTLNAPQQLLAITNALGNLNSTSAAMASSSIFGRMGYADIIQLKNSMGEVTEAMRGGATEGAKWQRVSAAFEQIEISLNRVKSIGMGFFAGIAEGLVPALQRGLTWLQSWQTTLTAIGQSIGRYLGALVEAFKEGRLGELIGLSLQTGFDSFMVLLPGLFEKMGAMLLKTFETPLIYLQAGMEYAMTAAAHAFFTSNAFQVIVKALDPTGGVAATIAAAYVGDSGKPDFAQILKDRKELGVQFDLGSGAFGIKDIDKDANSRLQAALAQIKTISKPLSDMIAGLMKNVPGLPASAPTKSNAEGANLDSKGHYKFEGTELEKMGFVMGGGNPALDYARRTARATEQIATLLNVHSGGGQGVFGSLPGAFANGL